LPGDRLLSAGLASRTASASKPEVRTSDYSGIRGANYCAAGGHHVEHWRNYDPRETERDLDYARKININHVRVFLSYTVYLQDARRAVALQAPSAPSDPQPGTINHAVELAR
jgi:hypothetical protein